jgi:hypothetical protein
MELVVESDKIATAFRAGEWAGRGLKYIGVLGIFCQFSFETVRIDISAFEKKTETKGAEQRSKGLDSFDYENGLKKVFLSNSPQLVSHRPFPNNGFSSPSLIPLLDRWGSEVTQ